MNRQQAVEAYLAERGHSNIEVTLDRGTWVIAGDTWFTGTEQIVEGPGSNDMPTRCYWQFAGLGKTLRVTATTTDEILEDAR